MTARAPSKRSTAWICLLLLTVSLTVRLAVFLSVGPNLPPLWDERGYFARAKACAAILEHLWGFEAPPEPLLDRAYGEGRWPPLHPLVMGASLAVFGESAVVARLAVLFFSALATPLVYLLALRAGFRRGALPAALVHLLYPGFVVMSHLMLSESVYIACLLATVLSVFGAVDAETGRRKLLLSFGAGLFLGLAALTRAAVLPFLVIIPGWLLIADRKSRHLWLRAGVLVVTALVVIAPWQWVIGTNESRFSPISTATSYNLLLGNNPHPGERGDRLRRRIRAKAKADGLNGDQAARALAFEEIQRDKLGFLGRSFTKLRGLWVLEEYVLRSMLMALYPPFPQAAAWGLLAYLLVSLLLVTALVAAGLLRGPPDRKGALLLALAVAGSLPPALTVSNTRIGLPLLAFLLPFAGEGATALRRLSRRRLAIVGLVLVLTTVNALEPPHGLAPTASSYYRHLVRRVDRLLGTRTPIADCLRIQVGLPRSSSSMQAPPWERLEVHLEGTGYRFREDIQLLVFDPSDCKYTFHVVGDNPVSALELSFRIDSSVADHVRPVERGRWQIWRPTDLDGVSVKWCGWAL